MKVLLAGATGAIGVPLVLALRDAGHQVTGIVRTDTGAASLRQLGATAVRADILDRTRLLRAVEERSFDAVVHEATALKKPPARFADMTATNRLRTEGTANLVEAAHLVGARRMLVQSIVFGYGFADHGPTPLTEDDPFGRPAGDRYDAVVDALRSAESQVFDDPDVDGVALRYGLFYGRDLDTMTRLLRRRLLPVTAATGSLSLVHHDDAAAATVAALERGHPNRAYNIVDDTPVSWRDYVRTVADVTGTPRSLTVPRWLLGLAAPYAAGFATEVSFRISNVRAREELGWTPRYPNCRDGIRAAGTSAPR